MKHLWINNTQCNELILFFNGWACDSEPFRFLGCENVDVLMLYNYTSLDIEDALVDKIKSYEKVKVVAWSFGVWVAQYIMEKLQIEATRAVAFNGTLLPIHEKEGIPKAIAEGTLNRLNERNLNKFQRRMCGGVNVWQQFQSHPPKRYFEEQKKELAALYQHFEAYQLSDNYFDTAVIANGDMIFSTLNQQAFWQGESEIELVEGAHFCFNNYIQWKQLSI